MQCAWCGLAGRWWCGGSIIYTALHQYELCPVPLKWPPGPGTSCSQHTGPAAATLGPGCEHGFWIQVWKINIHTCVLQWNLQPNIQTVNCSMFVECVGPCFSISLRLLVAWNMNMRRILFFTKLWHRKFQISNLRKVSLVKYWVLVQVKKLTKIN